MKAKYRHIIFDADHTLIDFNADERRAFRISIADIPPTEACNEQSTADMPPTEAHKASTSDMPPTDGDIVAHMQAYSLRNWFELGLDNVNDPVIRKQYHARTYEHVHALFEYATKKYHLKNAKEAERIFYQTLCLPAHPCQGSLEVVKALSKNYELSIATNGLSDMQRARLKEFKPYLKHLFISEEMKTIKPAEEFGQIMLDALQAGADECLFVGDSLSSDVALANKLNMDVIWVNPEGRPLPEGYCVKGQIKTLNELNKYI